VTYLADLESIAPVPPNRDNDNPFDQRMRRVVLIPYLVGVCLILLVANIPAWNGMVDRLGANVCALLGLAASYFQWRFPWHWYPRNLFLVITFGAAALIAVLVYFGGGQGPFDEYFFLLVVFAPLLYSLRVSLLVAVVVFAATLLPLVYGTPDPDFIPRQFVRGVALLVTVWVQNFMLRELIGKERARQTLLADLAEIRALRDALAQANAQLVEQATTDVLTGTLNHRALMASLNVQLEQARQRGQPLAVLFFDIDHFKAVNDTYGHQAGDLVLAHVAKITGTCLRASDALGRYGGEEFVVVLPGAALPDALQVGERIRATVAAHPLAQPNGDQITVSVSMGVAVCHDEHCSQRDLLHAADQALYAAKHGGRNQVRARSSIRLGAHASACWSTRAPSTCAPACATVAPLRRSRSPAPRARSRVPLRCAA
jgi:diguanylate cyclase (GGDEF)-like protein